MMFDEWWAQYLADGGRKHFNLMANEESSREAWSAGAMQIFAALIDGGFITEPYAAIAREEIALILSAGNATTPPQP